MSKCQTLNILGSVMMFRETVERVTNKGRNYGGFWGSTLKNVGNIKICREKK